MSCVYMWGVKSCGADLFGIILFQQAQTLFLLTQAQHEDTERAAAEVAKAQAELAEVRRRQIEQAAVGECQGGCSTLCCFCSSPLTALLSKLHTNRPSLSNKAGPARQQLPTDACTVFSPLLQAALLCSHLAARTRRLALLPQRLVAPTTARDTAHLQHCWQARRLGSWQPCCVHRTSHTTRLCWTMLRW